jgi:outer membrane protein assembly factor BamE (lipoprotein component of BamABCDE complex)
MVNVRPITPCLFVGGEKRRQGALFLLLIPLASCFVPPTLYRYSIPTRGALDTEALKFIVPGQTTKEEVLLTLGEPESSLENGSILVYWWFSRSQHRAVEEVFLFIGCDESGKVAKYKSCPVTTYATGFSGQLPSTRKRYAPEKLLEGW